MGGDPITSIPIITELGPWVLIAIFLFPKVLELVSNANWEKAGCGHSEGNGQCFGGD